MYAWRIPLPLRNDIRQRSLLFLRRQEMLVENTDLPTSSVFSISAGGEPMVKEKLLPVGVASLTIDSVILAHDGQTDGEYRRNSYMTIPLCTVVLC